MKKTNFMYASAIMMAFAFGMVSCEQSQDNPVPTPEPKNPIAEAIENGATLNDLVANAEFVKDNTLALPADVIVELANEMSLDAPLTIIADAEKPATIIAKAGFVISNKFELQNVNVNAAELEAPFISFNPNGSNIKNQDVYTDADAKDYYLLESINIEGCKIANLKNSFVATNGNWAVQSLTIKNNIIQLDDAKKNFIAFDNSGNCWSQNTVIDGNTIYNIAEKGEAYFVRCGNASNAAKIFGKNNGTGVSEFTLTNNTIINAFGAKQFGNNTPNNSKTTLNVKNNVFVDVYRLNKFIQGNNTKNIENNFIAIEKTEKVEGADGIATTVESIGFLSPATALDLNKENGGLALTPTGDAATAGDPRWIK